ncbi:DUF6236 family protein [Psychrobacter alimentarius]|uniref:DUF6236 family protein n=1 Tax=Psychrobacter alimentarius TaxID=261164 RepID=UPI001918FE3B|nr:DUF6236 family protein [Psychrobacter alimentarius]
MNRGIIATPGVVNRLPKGFQMKGNLSLDEMRYYALYWDKVVIPTNNLVHIGVPQEDAFISAGVIERPRVAFNGSYEGDQVTNAMLSCQSIVAKELVKDKKTDWVVQQFNDELIILDGYIEERNTLRIDLASCLPVPTGEVDIQDILNFKALRKNEFIALHEYLDEVYEQALLSPDPTLASKKAISNLTKSIEDLDKVTQEGFKEYMRHNLSTVFNLYKEKIVEGMIMDITMAALIGSPIIPAVTLGGIMSATMKVSVNSTQTFRPADENLKLAYLSKAQKDCIY